MRSSLQSRVHTSLKGLFPSLPEASSNPGFGQTQEAASHWDTVSISRLYLALSPSQSLSALGPGFITATVPLLARGGSVGSVPIRLRQPHPPAPASIATSHALALMSSHLSNRQN
ncbi:hypothetical protein BaRGS_00009708 [Batillaria attramentaria]|uniref:Uncharacterized protein n=1 Tax=Batillaria attramentaria TaxID=370345 RepID=A0ABD0LIQ0_9CAEN